MRKSYRVKTESDFQRVFNYGKSFANRYYVVYALHKSNQYHFRVGLSVSKKIAHTAVKRNQIKRYIRQSILELKPYLASNIDFLVIARKPSVEIDMLKTKSNLIHVFKLANLLSISDEKVNNVENRF